MLRQTFAGGVDMYRMNPLSKEPVMTAAPDRDPLDVLLDESSPRTSTVTDDVAVELAELQQLAAAEARVSRHRWVRPAVAGVASLVLLGGMATAAAAATGAWSPWAETPDASITYSLPSGVQCEERMGDVQGTDPAAVAVVENFYQTTDIDALLSDGALQETIAQLRTEDRSFINADGSRTPAGYGTEFYNADREYSTAVGRIISNALDAELAAQNVDVDAANISIAGEAHCPGATW
ncbi:hypothetical protein C5C46_13600 [Rathayibacter sp. AY1E6]|nr:hypothetical protein C5C46_13600 [Rathayibacter sp. AY1E6]